MTIILPLFFYIAGIATGLVIYKHYLRELHRMSIRIRTIQHGGKPARKRTRK